jgi:hypothetical protein
MEENLGWLVVSTYPNLKNDGVSSSVMMKFPTEWKVIKFHGYSHHQAVGDSGTYEDCSILGGKYGEDFTRNPPKDGL